MRERTFSKKANECEISRHPLQLRENSTSLFLPKQCGPLSFFLFKDWGFGEAIHLYSNLECLKDLVSELRRGMEWMLNDKKPFMNLL